MPTKTSIYMRSDHSGEKDDQRLAGIAEDDDPASAELIAFLDKLRSKRNRSSLW